MKKADWYFDFISPFAYIGLARLGRFSEALRGPFVACCLENKSCADAARALGLHEDTVRKRFHYRTPGLFVVIVRVYRLTAAIEIDEMPAYDGCRSWVELEKALPTESSTPVLDDESFRIVQKQLDLLLSPTAFV